MPKTLYYIRKNQIHQANVYEKGGFGGEIYYKIWIPPNQKIENDPYSYSFAILEEGCFFSLEEAISKNIEKINKKILKYQENIAKLQVILDEHTKIVEIPF